MYLLFVPQSVFLSLDFSPGHTKPTSSECGHRASPSGCSRVHDNKSASSPLHPTYSKKIGSTPGENSELILIINAPVSTRKM